MPAHTPVTLRTTQTLVLALLVGVVIFAVVVAVLLQGAPPSPPPAQPGPQVPQGQPRGMTVNPGLTGVLLVPTLGLAGIAIVLPALLTPKMIDAARREWERSARDDEARGAVPGRFQLVCIVRAAFAEGMGLFSTVAAMLTGEVLFFAGTALSVLLMLAMFPTGGRWREFYRRVTGEEPVGVP